MIQRDNGASERVSRGTNASGVLLAPLSIEGKDRIVAAIIIFLAVFLVCA